MHWKAYSHFGFLMMCMVLSQVSCSSNDNSKDSDADSETLVGAADFSVTVEVSEKISTVGIVKWSVDLDSIDRAQIDFGRDTDYGMVAPVDLTKADFKTLLLGMKPSSTYHFRISAIKGDTTYRSDDYSVDTGPVMNGLPTISIETNNENALARGFVVSDFSADSTAFILDADGDYVWWYKASVTEATRAAMSYDGMYMLAAGNVVDNNGSGELVKISMDGSEEESLDVPELSHDITVLPGNIIAYIAYDETGIGICDRIIELSEDGSKKEVYSLRTDFSRLAIDQEWCHSNAVLHDESEDAYYLSVLNFNSIVKIDRASRELQWVFGGEESDFDLGNDTWRMQHGFHVLKDGILLFNNAGNMWTNLSRALEYKLDEVSSTATLVWEYYDEDNGPANLFQGDVQRLPNGNTLVDYSAAGEWREVDAQGNLLRKIYWTMGGVTGYATWRESLYGPPPK